MNPINTQGGFNLPHKIDDSRSPEPEPEPDDPNEDEFDFSSHNPQMMYPPPPQQPFFQFSPPNTEKTSFFDGDNKMYFIILFIAFILGFFMGKTMQPIIIKST